MQVNPLRGETVVTLNGTPYRLFFGWEGLMLLQQALGRTDIDIAISELVAKLDLPALAKIMAIGLRDAWPGVTAEAILRASPPIAAVLPPVTQALRLTFDGGQEVPPEANPPRRPIVRALKRTWSWLASMLRWKRG